MSETLAARLESIADRIQAGSPAQVEDARTVREAAEKLKTAADRYCLARSPSGREACHLHKGHGGEHEGEPDLGGTVRWGDE